MRSFCSTRDTQALKRLVHVAHLYARNFATFQLPFAPRWVWVYRTLHCAVVQHVKDVLAALQLLTPVSQLLPKPDERYT
jgi:hypothetical protein